MEKLTLTTLSHDELTELVLSCVQKALNLAHPFQKSEENFLNLKQAAAFTLMPESTLYSYTSKRLIPHIKRGKRLLFKQSDLAQWLSDGKKKTIAEIEEELNSPKGRKGARR
ncbi:helix-turn-helix domain-containing protein [Pontibacter anaerobius]|uniref:Helix-turn-helix domain-containing protein n=1 Tax=Pontibacter anaerobius TaxID=2993940 RepID=A0ABT3RKT1_9BACT|nr:helix-turn-helix domain-containing protein [Pontibacter anaerobius]MCX2741988.1 helix-turn-helix domain-containing protein [Pontibacter anaerobius]